MNSKLKPASSRFKATSTRSKRIPSASRSEEHTSELQSLTNLVCRLLLEKKEHTSELQSLTKLVCRLLLETKERNRKPIAGVPQCRSKLLPDTIGYIGRDQRGDGGGDGP